MKRIWIGDEHQAPVPGSRVLREVLHGDLREARIGQHRTAAAGGLRVLAVRVRGARRAGARVRPRRGARPQHQRRVQARIGTRRAAASVPVVRSHLAYYSYRPYFNNF